MYDPEIQYEAFKMREQGYSYNKISEKLGMSKSTLNDWFSPDGRMKTMKRNASPNSRKRSKFKNFDIKGIPTNELIDLAKKRGFCYICGDPIDIDNDKYDLDHIIPKYEGGTDHINNMHPTHDNCNKMKGKMLFTDFLERVEKIFNYQRKQIHITNNEILINE